VSEKNKSMDLHGKKKVPEEKSALHFLGVRGRIAREPAKKAGRRKRENSGWQNER
jgi:hypothetical protein